jgi:3-oxoacyl-[acyl-carrier protein] reductase
MAEQRVILVTGAASGIGAAICRMMAGPTVCVLVHTRRNRAGAEQVAAAVRAAGGTAAAVLGDLADAAVAEDVVQRAAEVFGGLDVLVSNAGFALRGSMQTVSDADMTQSWEAIAGAFLRLVRAGLPHLRASGAGRVIGVSSFVAHVFRPDIAAFPASAAAKAGLEALIRTLAVELGPSGVTVNGVVPGFIEKDAAAHRAIDPAVLAAQTARIPLGRIGRPEDVAAAVAFLASPQAGYITGQSVHVNGGLLTT